ncbi:hypothetical protein C7M84_011667 [Penaeus vannamei]|uniref:Uncharacterized protein n=1 Tax=Penaeus vannamei TaxID=6689 RepID=A0A3R7NY91_PENVA|nr:hypothetical protein C7M84_011667 [Penaeus vannamei]
MSSLHTSTSSIIYIFPPPEVQIQLLHSSTSPHCSSPSPQVQIPLHFFPKFHSTCSPSPQYSSPPPEVQIPLHLFPKSTVFFSTSIFHASASSTSPLSSSLPAPCKASVGRRSLFSLPFSAVPCRPLVVVRCSLPFFVFLLFPAVPCRPPDFLCRSLPFLVVPLSWSAVPCCSLPFLIAVRRSLPSLIVPLLFPAVSCRPPVLCLLYRSLSPTCCSLPFSAVPCRPLVAGRRSLPLPVVHSSCAVRCLSLFSLASICCHRLFLASLFHPLLSSRPSCHAKLPYAILCHPVPPPHKTVHLTFSLPVLLVLCRSKPFLYFCYPLTSLCWPLSSLGIPLPPILALCRPFPPSVVPSHPLPPVPALCRPFSPTAAHSRPLSSLLTLCRPFRLLPPVPPSVLPSNPLPPIPALCRKGKRVQRECQLMLDRRVRAPALEGHARTRHDRHHKACAAIWPCGTMGHYWACGTTGCGTHHVPCLPSYLSAARRVGEGGVSENKLKRGGDRRHAVKE